MTDASPRAESPKKRRAVSILTSTGSIGNSALEVVRRYPDLFEVRGLGAGSNVAALADQIREFGPQYAAVADPEAAAELDRMDLGVTVLPGPEGLAEAAALPVDIVLCATVGAAGLQPLLAAIDGGNCVAVANKEPFVMAGPLITARARAQGVQILPVDSEHSAIFQCIQGQDRKAVDRIHLTASGGPFYGRSRAGLAEITPAEAVAHPTWDMGQKISVDSATLMNKGLEIMEAMWLFELAPEQVEVIIHPQSIVHSLVEFTDGNLLAHLGVTNMMFPILYALLWPERAPAPLERLDLAQMGALTFSRPDLSDFPCLGLARAAAAAGGTAPAILNAANEVAVEQFLAGKIGFLQISEVVVAVRESVPVQSADALETILVADRQARETARTCIQEMELPAP